MKSKLTLEDFERFIKDIEVEMMKPKVYTFYVGNIIISGTDYKEVMKIYYKELVKLIKEE